MSIRSLTHTNEILAAGGERVRREAQRTLHEVRGAMHLDYFGL